MKTGSLVGVAAALVLAAVVGAALLGGGARPGGSGAQPRPPADAGGSSAQANLASGGTPQAGMPLRQPPPRYPSAGRTCGSADLAIRLVWARQPDGALDGHVIATNTSDRPCDLLVKPALSPYGRDGRLLDTSTITTSEGLIGPQIVPPGVTVRAKVGWWSWCGDAASGDVRVSWDGGRERVRADGPAQPGCRPGEPTNLGAGWFEIPR